MDCYDMHAEMYAETGDAQERWDDDYADDRKVEKENLCPCCGATSEIHDKEEDDTGYTYTLLCDATPLDACPKYDGEQYSWTVWVHADYLEARYYGDYY